MSIATGASYICCRMSFRRQFLRAPISITLVGPDQWGLGSPIGFVECVGVLVRVVQIPALSADPSHASACGADPSQALCRSLTGTLQIPHRLSPLRIAPTTQAVSDLRAAVRIDPDSVLAHVHLGMALHRNNQQSEAVTCFEAAVAQFPKSPDVLNYYGEILLELGERS